MYLLYLLLDQQVCLYAGSETYTEQQSLSTAIEQVGPRLSRAISGWRVKQK